MIEWWWLIPASIGALLVLVVQAVRRLFSASVRQQLREWLGKASGPLAALRISGAVAIYAVGIVFLASLVFAAVQVLKGSYDLDSLSKLGPTATALAATVAFIVGIATIWQRIKTDRREQWWKRTEWALGWAYGTKGDGGSAGADPDDERKRVGVLAVRYQQKSRLAGREEIQFLRASVDDAVEDIQDEVREATLGGKTSVEFRLDEEAGGDQGGVEP